MSGRLPLSDFDFDYPEALVASTPAEPRDSSRLLVVNRATGSIEHSVFEELPRFLRKGDCLVLNRTKVLACRLLGRKSTGGKVDILLVGQAASGEWRALSSGLKAGQRLEFAGGLSASVLGLDEEGQYRLAFETPDLRSFLAEHGLPPLPPYIAKRRRPSREDLDRYQTVYARDEGSIAAPTAGLHFTETLLDRLRAQGVLTAWVTLHVGRGTFRPIQGDDASAHVMLPESYEVEPAQAELIGRAKARGGRLICVGTTAVRTVETLAGLPGGLAVGRGASSLYIRPGYSFRALDALITNFHLPRSTPLLLACAFAGRDLLLAAYREAIERRYRLYSYGDATLIQ